MIRLGTIALLLVLAACAGPAPPPDSFYRIEPKAASAPLAAPVLPGTLEVERLATDGVLAERALTFTEADGAALRHYKYDFWSEPPGLMLQGALARHLARAGVAGRVVTPELRVLADWTLRGKLLRFEQVAANSQVAVELQLGVVSARDGALVLLESYGARIPAGSDRVEDAARAMEQGIGDIFARFTADLVQARSGVARP